MQIRPSSDLICDCVLKYFYDTKDLLIEMVEDTAKLPLYFFFLRTAWASVSFLALETRCHNEASLYSGPAF